MWLGSLGSNVYSILLFSILSVVIFHMVPIRARKMVLLAESLLFYGLCDLRFLGLVAGETLLSWYLGRKIEGSSAVHSESGRKSANILATFGIAASVAILAVFKYEHFFAEAFSFTLAELVMPLGLSYYSFRIISYLADIRRNRRSAEPSLIGYAGYILFFPHMVSGPIVRSENFLEELSGGLRWNPELAEEGICQIISGLFKKIVIADRIQPYVSTIFASYENYPAAALWLALFLNACYIYCDFAGYSEIAIGVTKLFGITCEPNFNRPYLAENMKEFWHRWHISLSSWLRDYIYIPLGGNRAGKLRTKLNVMAVFAVCGIWHGNTPMYLLWGIYHGILNILVPAGKKNSKKRFPGLRKALGILWVFFCSLFGWLLFRSESLTFLTGYVKHLFCLRSFSYSDIVSSILPFTGDMTCVAYFLTALMMLAVLAVMEIRDEIHQNAGDGKCLSRERVWRVMLLVLLSLMFGMVGSGSFLYANY